MPLVYARSYIADPSFIAVVLLLGGALLEAL